MANATRTRYVQTAPKARNDAYTGLLFISFLALVTSAILLYLDYSQYGTSTAPKPSIATPGSSPVGGVPGPPIPDTGAAPAEGNVPMNVPMGDVPAPAPMPVNPAGPPMPK